MTIKYRVYYLNSKQGLVSSIIDTLRLVNDFCVSHNVLHIEEIIE